MYSHHIFRYRQLVKVENIWNAEDIWWMGKATPGILFYCVSSVIYFSINYYINIVQNMYNSRGVCLCCLWSDPSRRSYLFSLLRDSYVFEMASIFAEFWGHFLYYKHYNRRILSRFLFQYWTKGPSTLGKSSYFLFSGVEWERGHWDKWPTNYYFN